MSAWQYYFAADGAPNWSSFTDAVDSGGAGSGEVDPGGSDGLPGQSAGFSIPIVLRLTRNNPPRLRVVQAINGGGAWFGGYITQSFTTTAAIGELTDVNGAANSIAEHATPGTSVGVQVRALDPNGSVPTYALTSTYGGRFEIDSSTGAVYVGSTGIEYDDAASYSLTATATFPDGTIKSLSFVIQVVEVLSVDFGDYEKTDEGVGTNNRVGDSEPELAELFAATNAVQVTSGLNGFFDRAVEFTDNSVLSLAYHQLATPAASGETFKISCFVKLPDHGTQPAVNSATTSGYDCSLVIDNAPRTPDAIFEAGDGWWRFEFTYTFPGSPASQSMGLVKYTTQSSKRVWVTGFDIRELETTSDVLNGWSALSSGDQTYKALYDARKASYAAAESLILTSPYSELRSYTGAYWVWASLLMYLATGTASYAEEALDQCDEIIAGFTITDDLGYLNMGGQSTGAGVTTYTAGGVNAPAGTVTSYLLDEVQGGSMLALVAAFVLSQSGLSALHTQAEGVRDFVAENILGKWHVRNAVTGTLSRLNPGYTGGGQDQALHLGVMSYALYRAGATPETTEQYQSWGDQTISNINARLVDSSPVSPNTPSTGAKYMEVPGLFDTSHNNRYPYGIWAFWLLGNPAGTKANLEAMGKHFESMLWNQSTSAPQFSSDYRGGSPFASSAYSNVYTGWCVSSGASEDAETLMAAVVAHIAAGGSITGNTYQAGVLSLIAAEMAGRAIRASMS